MKNLNWIKENYFAHRGLHTATVPENSTQAFLDAVALGFDIEMDIRLTKDEQIVIIHDSNLTRLCNVNMKVENSTYDEIKELNLLNSKEHIPLFTDVLDLLPKDTKILIELKPSNNHKKLVSRFLKVMTKYNFKYAIHSFDIRIVNDFRKMKPEVIRGHISSMFSDKKNPVYFFLRHLLLNPIIKPDFINYHFEDLPRKKLDKLHQKGMMILSYTARSQADLDFVRDRYDNAVFEGFIPKK